MTNHKMRKSTNEETFWGVSTERCEDQLHDRKPCEHAFDLEERTARFGEAVIQFAKKIPFNPINNRVIDQLVGAATSVGANYCEANDACSRKDFKHKIATCRKEARETQFFLRMIVTSEPGLKDDARALWLEARELNLIFSAIWRRTRIQ
jgi:four helix bundle protein